MQNCKKTPPPIETLRKRVTRADLPKLKVIIGLLHPEKLKYLNSNEEIVNNASKKSILCLFGFDDCLDHLIALPNSKVLEEEKKEKDKEYLIFEEIEYANQEEKMLQRALQESFDCVPLIDIARQLVQRSANAVDLERRKAEEQEAFNKLYEHMIGVLPVLSGLVSQETRMNMTINLPVFVYTSMTHLNRQQQYRNFVQRYMENWLKRTLSFEINLNQEQIENVLNRIEKVLDERKTVVLGWNVF